MSSEKSILAGTWKDRNLAETYVLVQNLTAIIQRLLANDQNITEMRVLGFQLSSDDIQAIAYALTENKTLRALSLDHLQIGDEGAKQLAQGLCYNQSLTYISLRWNNIGNEGGAALADALHYNKGLKTFVLAFNNLGPAAGQAFANAIKKNNTVLETLDLKWNQIDDESGDMILDAMSENKGAFSSLMIGGNGSTLRNVGKNTGDARSSKRAKSMRFGFGKDKKAASGQTVSLEQLKQDLKNVAMAQEYEYEEDDEEEARELEVGDLVEVRGNEPGGATRRGRVRYIGPTDFAEGIWVGVEFETAVGMNDGTVNDKRYFTCPAKHGSFLKPDKLVFIEDE